VRLGIGALVLVTMVGVLGYVLISGGQHGLVDAVYMTVITLTTVGFTEVIDMSGNPVGRVFTIFLLLGGMGIVAYTVPMLAALVIEGQLHHIFQRRRMQKTIAEMTDHFIVCGDRGSAWYVAQELASTRRPVVLVAPTEELYHEAVEYIGEIPGVAGDPTDDDTLAAAGIGRAAGIVFALREDKENVLGVLTARRAAPAIRIIAACQSTVNEPKLRTAGANAVVSPARIGGLRMASELVRPKVVSFLDQMLREKGGSLRVEEVTVPADANVSGHTLGSLKIDAIDGVLLLAVRHPEGAFAFKPGDSLPIEPGMTLIVMSDADGQRRLQTHFHHATGTYPTVRTQG